MNDKMWTVARFPNGSWATGGKVDDPDYAECEVFRVSATTDKEAKKKAQAQRRKSTPSVAKAAS